jgi:myo-inositol-1(or 4)-monophosphatase
MLLFSISIAAVYEGRPIAAVVFEPATDSMYTAVKDGEAQLNSRRIQASEQQMDGFSSVGLDSHFDEPLPGWVCKIICQTRYRNLGTTALQLSYVAKGGLVATVITRAKIWDIAAGALIAQTAGAMVTDWKGGEILPFDLENYGGEELWVLAANKKVHPKILEMISAQ